ncbi:MAG: hypothetical protein ABSC89_05275 [Verrucomicrobiota bacterium]|jgi:hypothetical protein
MTWIAQNLWLIPVLPLAAADGIGAERRKTVAHGVSRGIPDRNKTSPVGAAE